MMNEDPSPALPYNFLEGATLLVDKPMGWTSFDVVNKIRYKLKQRLKVKNIKVGHAGTLDPMATGLLVICTGKHTKTIAELQGMDKEYTGAMVLGASTPSYDAETPIDAHYPTDHLSAELLEATRHQFLGEIDQAPPMFSAIKVDGQPLYKKARQGETIAVATRRVTLFAFDITHVQLPVLQFHVHCSKGTYIRSLAYDFGKAAGSGAYLSALRRTRVGPFLLENAWNLEELIQAV